ncbi:hypothetical protein J4732_07485 [Serratia marcescens]|uniref:Uncharacterized protein n=1 Tax=Serratia marcescens TaxID=615 RepID=A0A939SNK9_SERMA|nr:hypothetical protein [Serratia marcescens]
MEPYIAGNDKKPDYPVRAASNVLSAGAAQRPPAQQRQLMQSPFLSSLRVGLWLLGGLLVQAGPADEFAAAVRSRQTAAGWAAEPDAARACRCRGLRQETVASTGEARLYPPGAIAICRSRARRHRLAN